MHTAFIKPFASLLISCVLSLSKGSVCTTYFATTFLVSSLFLSLHPALKKVSLFQRDRVGLVNGALPEEEEEGQLGEEGGEGEEGGGGEEGGEGGGGKGGLLLLKRRNKLPCPTPEMADFSLWSILRKNIGI